MKIREYFDNLDTDELESIKEKAAKWDLYLEKGSASESFLEQENKRLKELLATVEKDH